MLSTFDPYYKWLGIPPAEQPPHHYRLLGITLFEADPDVIEAAADQRMVHLRSFQTGQQAAFSQKLLNEVAAARLCLLRADRKAAYDALLRQQLAAGVPAPPVAAVADFAAASHAAAHHASPQSAAPHEDHWDSDPLGLSSSTPTLARPVTPARSKSMLPLALIIGAPILGMVVVIVAINIFNDREKAESDNSQSKTATTGTVGDKDKRATLPADPHPDITVAEPKPPLLVVEWAPADRRDGFLILDGTTYDVSQQSGALEYKLTPREHKLQLRRHGLMPIDFTVPLTKDGERFVYRPQWQPIAGQDPTTGVAADDHHPTTGVPSDDPLEKPPLVNNPADKKPGGDDKPPEPADPNSQPVAPARTPVPDAAAQQKALAQLKEVLKDDYAQAKTPEAQLALARKLCDLAKQEVDKNPVMSYVMANQSLEMAVRQCEPALASQLVGGISTHFEVDAWELKADTLNQLAHTAKTNDARAGLAKASLDLVDKAIADDRYDVALELAGTGTFLAAQVKEIAMRDVARDATERAKRVQKGAQDAKLAADTLLAQPNDPDANLTLGKFKCFLKEDWKLGLPLLAKGNDEPLKGLAEQDLADPTAAPDQVKLADAWWDFADQIAADKSDAAKKDEWLAQPLRMRAVHWYKLAAPSLAGLGLADAQKRITDIEATSAETIALETTFLDDLPEQGVSVGYGRLGKHGETGYPGNPTDPERVKVRGAAAQHALSMHPPSNGAATVSYNLDGKYRSFSGIAAIMDDSKELRSSATFKVVGDGKVLWTSRPLRRAGELQECSIHVSGVQSLKLEVTCSGQFQGMHAVWLTPTLTK